MPARERRTGFARALAGAVLVMLLAPAGAAATVRYASPSGSNSGDCTAAACTLQRAVEVVAVAGDEVMVLPGTYNEGANPLDVGPSLWVHGPTGQSYPQLNFSPPGDTHGVQVTGSTLGHLSVSVSSSPGSAAVHLASGVGEQLQTQATTFGTWACRVGDALLRDSICWATGTSARGVIATEVGTGVPGSLMRSGSLRNVTTIATAGTSLGIDVEADDGAVVSLDSDNVIADGATDVQARAVDATSTATASLDHSNYATEVEFPNGGTASVTNPGTGANQTVSPAFSSPGNGDFRQLSFSPTIDAGGFSALMGSVDLDGDARAIDATPHCSGNLALPDIGADEYKPGSLDCISPETILLAGPKAKTAKRRAAFAFMASKSGAFECSLDQLPFVRCTSPLLYAGLRPGKHLFSVRALDNSGNVDTSPALRIWTVKKRGRKHPKK